MFESTMLDSTPRARSQRRWTTLLSVGIQLTMLGGLLFLPLLSPDSIPRLRFAERIMVPTVNASGPESPTEPSRGKPPSSASVEATGLVQPPRVPDHTAEGDGTVPKRPSSDLPSRPCVGNCRGPGGSDLGVPYGLGEHFVPTIRESAPPPKRVIISALDPGFLVHRVQPVYPPMAKQFGVQGPVVLRAVIGKDGEIQELRVISGHPLLSPAAREAVAQWRYRPYMLNGVAVEVETQVTVNFYLSGR